MLNLSCLHCGVVVFSVQRPKIGVDLHDHCLTLSYVRLSSAPLSIVAIPEVALQNLSHNYFNKINKTSNQFR